MKINTMFSIFTPKDIKFIPLLEELAGVLVTASSIFEKALSLPDKDLKEACQLVKAEELKGDRISGQIFKALNETFITPFDREDIHALADAMDDIVDALNRTTQKILIYEPKRLSKHVLLLATVVRKGSEEVQQAVHKLSNLKKTDKEVRLHCKEIKRLEEEADTLYEGGIMSLFHDETNTVELVKLKEIIQELEHSVNKINSTGKIMRTILVKYS